MLEPLSNKVATLKAGNFIKKRLQHRCFPLNIAKFLRTAFFIEDLGWLFLRRFLLKRVADLVRVCFLHVISRNHSNTFLLINVQSSNIRILTVWTGFCSLLNAYFNDVQIDR